MCLFYDRIRTLWHSEGYGHRLIYSCENRNKTLSQVIKSSLDIVAKVQATKRKGKKEDKLDFTKLKNYWKDNPYDRRGFCK